MKTKMSFNSQSWLLLTWIGGIALFAYHCSAEPMQTVDNLRLTPGDNAATCTPDPSKRVIRGTSIARVLDPTDIGTEEDANWDVYESNNVHPNSEAWIGNGGSVDASFTGLRFRNLAIPAGAKVESARLVLNHPTANTSGQWISVGFNLQGETSRSPVDFVVGQPLVSARPRTTSVTTFAQDFRWELGIEWVLDVTAIVKEVAAPSAPSSIALLAHGMSNGQWGRMYFQPVGPQAPRLEVTHVKTLPLCTPPGGGGAPPKRCYTCTKDDGSRPDGVGCGTTERCTPDTLGCQAPKDPCPGGSVANACTDC